MELDNQTELNSNNTTETQEVSEIQTNSFLENVNEEFRNNPSIKDFKDVNGLVKSYINQQKLIGKSDIPGEKSTPEEWNKFYSKIGRPENIDGYSVPEGLEQDELLNTFKQVSFEKGLSNNQFSEIVNMFNQYTSTVEEKNKQTFEEQSKSYIEQFNKTFGEDAENVKTNAQNLLKKYATEEDFEVLNNLDLNQTISLSKILYKMSNKNLKESDVITGTPSSNKMPLQDIVKRIEELDKTLIFKEDNKEYQDLLAQKRQAYLNGSSLYN